MIKKISLGLLLLLAVMTVGYAQSSQSGTLMGVVALEDGVTIPGVTVVATSPALMGKMTAVTNENGVYRFSQLPVGMYEITFQLEGFRTVIRKDIRVASLQTYTINASMRQEAIQEAIVVTGQGPTVDTQRQTRAANFDLQFLKSLPAPRNLDNFVNMAPGMTSGSAHGAATMDNSYNLDGVNLGDPATGVSNVSFGLDIMDEISVQTGALSAEFGSVRGAMINVVTKSGGNRVTGGASFFLNHESLVGNNRKGTVLEKEGLTGNHLEFEPSFSIGGPVVKDKLWFFASATYKQAQTYAIGFPYDKPNAKTIIKVTQPLPYIKLTYQLDQKNKFTLSYNYSDRINNNRNADRFHTEANTVTQTTPTHVVNMNWNHYFGENVYANFKVGISKFNMKLDSNTVAANTYDYYTGQYWATSGSFRTQDHNQRDRYNVNLDATTFVDNFMGTHELKIGGEAQLARVGWLIYGMPDPISGAHVNYMDGNTYLWGLYLVGNGFDRKDNMDDYFGFINDTWRVNKHLTVNLGVRLDYNSLSWPKQGDAGAITLPGDLSYLTVNRSIASPITAMSWTNLAPRFGFIYDLLGDNKTLVKASWSRYTVANQTGWINSAHPNGWVGYDAHLDPVTGKKITGGEWVWSVPAGIKIGYNDYKLKASYTDELTVGVERELFTDWSASARYIQKWDRNLIHNVDASQLDIDKLMSTGELDWSKNWVAKTGIDPYDGKTVTFYSKLNASASDIHIVNPPGAERDYQGIEVTFNKRFSHGWALNTSYVYGKGTGLVDQGRTSAALGTSGLFSNPNNHINAFGTLDLDSRHQFKVQGLLNGPLGINLSGYFRYLSGLVYTRTISSGKLGVSTKPTSFTILAEERGSRRLPDAVRLDLRLEKTFKIGNVSLSAFADCFNALNQGVATSVWGNSSNKTYAFERMMTINDPRMFQLGARIEFK
jgi:hypothetical protein